MPDDGEAIQGGKPMKVNICSRTIGGIPVLKDTYYVRECANCGKAAQYDVCNTCLATRLADEDFQNLIDLSNGKRQLEQKVYRIGKKVVSAAVVMGIINTTVMIASAAVTGTPIAPVGIEHVLDPLIHMVQSFGVPVGIAVSSWGGIEIMMGNKDGGMRKIKYALLGFVAMFIVPYIFYVLDKGLAKLT
jgi:hypothetical protein